MAVQLRGIAVSPAGTCITQRVYTLGVGAGASSHESLSDMHVLESLIPLVPWISWAFTVFVISSLLGCVSCYPGVPNSSRPIAVGTLSHFLLTSATSLRKGPTFLAVFSPNPVYVYLS